MNHILCMELAPTRPICGAWDVDPTPVKFKDLDCPDCIAILERAHDAATRGDTWRCPICGTPARGGETDARGEAA